MRHSKLCLLFVSILALQACSLSEKPFPHEGKNEQNENVADNSEIKEIGKNIISLGDIPKATSNTVVSDTNSSDSSDANSNNSINEANARYKVFITQQALLKSQLSAQQQTLYKSAIVEMKQKQWQGASDLFDDFIQQNPNLSEAYLNKALAHYQLQQWDIAVAVLKKAEKISALNPYIYNLQGVIARQQGQFIAAEKYYQQALALWPDYPAVHLNMAVLLELYRGKYIQAKQHYQAYLTLKPNDVKAKQWLAGLEIKLAARKET